MQGYMSELKLRPPNGNSKALKLFFIERSIWEPLVPQDKLKL